MRTPADFLRIVRAETARGSICILYAEAFSPATASPDKIWPEMLEPSFREAVQVELPAGNFAEPDDLDGWVYVCYPAKL